MPAASSRANRRSFSIPRQTFTEVASASSVPTPALYLEVERIAPAAHNPRRNLGDVTQLAESIDTYGLLQPLVVREAGPGYELIAGHRRLAAIRYLRGLDGARRDRWRQVPAIVHTADDEQALLLAGQENLQRQDLSPRDQALYLELYVRRYGGVRKAAEVLKLSHTYVGQRCRVFADDALAGPVLAERLDVSSAQELLRVADPAARARILEQALAGDWSKSRIRQEVDRWNAAIPAVPGRAALDGRLEAMMGELEADPRRAQSGGAARGKQAPAPADVAGRAGTRTTEAAEEGSPNGPDAEPRIVTWRPAPA